MSPKKYLELFGVKFETKHLPEKLTRELTRVHEYDKQFVELDDHLKANYLLKHLPK